MMRQLISLAETASSTDGFNLGTLLMFVGGAVLLAFFCSLGLIARIRERRLELRRDRTRDHPSPSVEGSASADPGQA